MKQSLQQERFALHFETRLKDPFFSKKFSKSLKEVLGLMQKHFNSFAHKDLKKAEEISLSLTVCSNQKIKRLNRDYRNKDKVTDVLSFPVFESLRKGESEEIFPGPIELGDIVICYPRCVAQAKEYKVTPEQEFYHLLIHGYLHLLGYDHEISLEEEKIMQREESKLVKKIYQTLGWERS